MNEISPELKINLSKDGFSFFLSFKDSFPLKGKTNVGKTIVSPSLPGGVFLGQKFEWGYAISGLHFGAIADTFDRVL